MVEGTLDIHNETVLQHLILRIMLHGVLCYIFKIKPENIKKQH